MPSLHFHVFFYSRISSSNINRNWWRRKIWNWEGISMTSILDLKNYFYFTLMMMVRWGEMWKWGSEINKFCKNFFVLSLDHRWAAAATGNIVVVGFDFSIVHSRWWSFLCFHGKHKRSLEITFFCYLRESEPSRSRSADKTRSFFFINDELSLIISWSSPNLPSVMMIITEVPNVYWTSMEF